MSHFIINILAFLVAIAILVPFHEFGHFWVARKLGVKVQRFAVGFGKVLWSRRGRDGVEYCLCAIPLGGYVKMLNERQGPVDEAELPYAFNRQKVWKRFLIVLAGPVFNLLLAFLLCIAVFKIGFQGTIPILGDIPEGSPAQISGLKIHDELVDIDGHLTPTTDNVRQMWLHYLDKPSFPLTVKRNNHLEKIVFNQPLIHPSATTDFLRILGIHFVLPPILGDIAPDSPAMKARLQKGDLVQSIDEQPTKSWEDLVNIVSDHPHKSVIMHVLRNGKMLDITVVPDARADGSGMIGAHLPNDLLRTGSFSWKNSIEEAFRETYQMTFLNIKLLGQMATGSASFDNISGPVTIARVAGSSAEQGISPYLYFLAMISIGLAVLNLLPIPMLDGGHLLFYIIEIIIRRPLSERAQEMSMRIGVAILLSLMLIALYNDMMQWSS